jgi:TolA-binding protein
VTDASAIYKRYIALHPKVPQAVLFYIRFLEAYEKGRYAKLTLEAKEQFVSQFHFNQAYWRRDETQALKAQVEPYLKKHMQELARHYHAVAQKSKDPADYTIAEKWYRLFVDIFTDDALAPSMHFLMAEALMESNQIEKAAGEYEVTAYKYNEHAKAAEAGYAAILAYAGLEKSSSSERRKNHWRERSIDNALRFSERFPEDKRASTVLTNAAQSLFRDKDYAEAINVAYNVLTLSSSAAKDLQLNAWTVVAHSQFEQENFSEAEIAYRQLLARLPKEDSRHKELQERLAASVYKQGEKMRRQGNEKAAYAQFQRVGELAPGANISVTAQFDAAASLLAQKQWLAAAQTLNEFRSRNPGHQLSQQVPEKLYLAYVQSEQWSRAAAELENMGNYKSNEVERRTISLRAGELYEKAGQFDNAVRIYKTYVGLYPKPLEQAVEIRFKLAGIAKEHENANRHKYWLNEVIQADAQGGRERNDRTRFLAAQSALELAEPAYQDFTKEELLFLKTFYERPMMRQIFDRVEEAIGQAYASQLGAFKSAYKL